MIRTLIVDDEPLARRNLAVLLRGDPEIVIIGECASGAEAVRPRPASCRHFRDCL